MCMYFIYLHFLCINHTKSTMKTQINKYTHMFYIIFALVIGDIFLAFNINFIVLYKNIIRKRNLKNNDLSLIIVGNGKHIFFWLFMLLK